MISRTPSSACRQRTIQVLIERRTRFHAATTFRHYSPAGKSPKIEVLPPPPSSSNGVKTRSPFVRFLNPWIDMANATDDAILAFKVESVTRTFGVVAAVMASLSAASLAVTPSAPPPQDDNDEQALLANMKEVSHDASQQQQEVTLLEGILEYIVYTNHVAGTSLLVSWGVAPKKLADIHSACCAASFCSSITAMGISSALNAWLGCTPPGGTKHFVRYHSLAICSVPALLALSTGLAGIALFIGLDRSKGTPISYIGLGGTIIGGIMVGTTTARGMICTYRLLTPLVKK